MSAAQYQSPTTRLAFAQAYAVKAEFGGGFRGAAKNVLTGEILKGENREIFTSDEYNLANRE